VVNERPFAVEECSVGTGAACGAIYLNQQFEASLQKRFEGKGENILSEKKLKELLTQFESTIKREYNPLDPTSEQEFEVIFGSPDMPDVGVEDGYLSLKK
jgi:hypothetical protein